MTYRRQIGTLLLVGGLLVHGPAGASTTPAERCAGSQLTATGKLARASLACHATTATKDFPPGPCVTTATAAFEKAWDAAEAKGGCTTTATTADVETEVGGVVAAAVGEITGTPEDALLTTSAARTCAANKLDGASKDALAQLMCAAKGAKHATVFSSACVERAGAALVKAWGKAEGAGGCVTEGDNEALNIDGLRAWGVGHLGGPFTPPSCGTPVTAWGSVGDGDGQFAFSLGPVGVAVDGSGNVFITDPGNHRIQKFDNNGTFLLTFGWGVKDGAAALETCKSGCEGGLAGSGNGQFNNPQGVAVDGSGNVFVADLSNNLIQKFDSSGKFLTAWGSPGSSDGQFNQPQSVAVDGSGFVFVTDVRNHRIQKFTNTGMFSKAWGSQGSGEGQFNTPFGVAVDGSGNVFVTDTSNFSIQKFTNTGMFLTAWGGTNGVGVGQFNFPEGVAADEGGNVFVTDVGDARVQVFTGTGAILTLWLAGGATEVAVDGSGNVFVTEFSTVQKFACPVPPPPPPLCGLIAGDPAAGTAVCGGPCPLEFPACVWVPAAGGGGACECVDNPCAPGIPSGCSGTFCTIQSQTCGTSCTCQ